MELFEFEEQMKKILCKASEASDLYLDGYTVSCDPDFIADFGCDHIGRFSIEGNSFPLKIQDMTEIRYRCNSDTSNYDFSDCFFRFNFGDSIYLDCYFDECSMGETFHVKYNDTDKFRLNKTQAIELLKQCAENSIKTE